MKGILLAGGHGTRLYPLTKATSKQLLPVYDKPLVYYPLSVLMLAGIRDVLIISSSRDLPNIENLFGDGGKLGMEIRYQVQEEPRGIPEAFILGEEFIAGEPVCLVLGDNIFHGQNLVDRLQHQDSLLMGATIFACNVSNPQAFGVIVFDGDERPIKIIEKPDRPVSNWAVTGLYFYDSRVCEFARRLELSPRGELEISDLNQFYLDDSSLRVEKLGRGTAWLDAGTHDDLLSASLYVQTLEKRQGLKVACVEEIAYRVGFISADDLLALADEVPNQDLRTYLREVSKERH
jgi:glucose-1-phosphate thymidylyltransferase